MARVRPEAGTLTVPARGKIGWNPHTLAQDTLAHHKGEGHAAQTHHKGEGHEAQTLPSCNPGGVRIPGSEDNAPIVSHAPSGWLYDRAEGLRAQTRSNTESRDCAQPRAPIYKGLGEAVWENHRLGVELGDNQTHYLPSYFSDLLGVFLIKGLSVGNAVCVRHRRRTYVST